jgi:hypothetical protein
METLAHIAVPRPRGPGQGDPRQQGVFVRVESRRLALLYVELDETRRDWGITEYDYLVLVNAFAGAGAGMPSLISLLTNHSTTKKSLKCRFIRSPTTSLALDNENAYFQILTLRFAYLRSIFK